MKNKVLIFLAVIASVFTACDSLINSEKEDSIASGTELSATLKSAEISVTETAENALEELSYEAEFYAESEHLLRMLSHTRGIRHVLKGYQCDRYNDGIAPDISIDTADTGYPIVITVDYGDSTNVSNGRNITGLVTIEISASDTVDGATQTITFTDCVVDTVAINGELERIFNGDNSASRLITTTSDVTFTIDDTTKYYRTSEQVREWISGLETPMEHHDDEIQVTGTTTITNFDGVTWQRIITDPLLRIAECRNYVQGIIEITQDGTVLATLDYGSGDCDNVATLTTADGEVTEIELHVGKGDRHGGKSKGGKHGGHKGGH